MKNSNTRTDAHGVELRNDGDTTLLPVQVQAGASRSRVTGIHAGRLKVAVTTAPEKGKANREVIVLLADFFGVAPKHIRIEKGETNPCKLIRINMPGTEVSHCLRSL